MAIDTKTCLAIGSQHIGEIAKIFHEAKIPALLWGWWAAALVGEYDPSVEAVDFVVPDQLLQKATDTLMAAGYSRCTKKDCPYSHLITDIHFDSSPQDLWGPIRLYPKSSIVWWVPDPPVGNSVENDPHFIMSNDHRLPAAADQGPCGPWPDVFPVTVLRPKEFTEALILLMCRDITHANALDMYWRNMLHMMREVRENPDAVHVKTLRPILQRFWDEYNAGSADKQNIWRRLKAIREELIQTRVIELPPPPPFNGFPSLEDARLNGRSLDTI
ncbi:uncharacterized protein N7459_006362 [Penicillium hispanicum]|uniref:uncharacterized protein n=1 Tax=Penicillium hispanicum TaxID=1080232 RepID=UPI0025426184|nr:uncharacterized protein N7459_006362 [Penicillium hispanicum]KAJ5577398.1 hypothetical protein N7459_006362 [Penicillium hispanicum]